MDQFDITIVGGGFVGASMALALRDSSLKIALIDARMPTQDDPRLFALNALSCQFLKNLHVWDDLQAEACPIDQVHVSYRGRFGAVRLTNEEVSLATLGHVIPARCIEAAMQKKLAGLPNLTLFQPATLKALSFQEQPFSSGLVAPSLLSLKTEKGDKEIQSAVVIGADGTYSTVRSLLNIDTEIIDYGQSAIVTRTTLNRSHDNIAYERFNQDGAIAMLPLMHDECATIWTATNAKIAALMTLSEQDFLKALQTEFGYKLGRLKGITTRHTFPLQMVRAEKMVVGKVLLLGNSVHTLHPIAAQGFNLAIFEVAYLVENIMNALQEGQSVDSLDLENFSEDLASRQYFTTNASHRLSTLFATQSSLLGAMLQLGMIGLDVTTPVKRYLLKKLLGKTGRVPRYLMST